MRKIKIIFCFVIIFFILINRSFAVEKDILEEQEEEFNIADFLEKSKEHSEYIFEENIEDTFKEVMSGKVNMDNLKNVIFKLLGKEIRKYLKTIINIFSIIIIHTVLKAIADSLKDSSISKIVFYVEYIAIVSIIMNDFIEIVKITKNAVSELSSYINILIPLLITFVVYTGNITISSTIQPLILFMINFITNTMQRLIIPSVFIYTTFVIISKISDRIEISNISKAIQSGIKWTLSIMLVTFVATISLEGSLASTVDGIALKTTKSVVSTTVPIVGKILGDAVDSVLGATDILKNAVGVIGMLVLFGIAIGPIIKLFVIIIFYKILTIIVEPIADKKIVELLSNISNIFSILMAILITISVLFILGTSLILKISNITMMYR